MVKKEVVWPIRMTQEFKDKFKKYCDDKGYSMNKLVKVLIENEINKKDE